MKPITNFIKHRQFDFAFYYPRTFISFAKDLKEEGLCWEYISLVVLDMYRCTIVLL